MKDATRNDKSRFFAHHIDCCDIEWNNDDGNWCLDNHTISTMTFILKKTSNPKLILSPLSKIIDEDAIELSNILGTTQHLYFINAITIQDSRYVINSIDSIRAYQFLQSRGYALPYLHWSIKDLIELGWIKLKEETK